MSTPDATGSGRPLRTAGLALLGLAAVLLMVGVIDLLGDDDPSGAAPAGRPPATTTAQPGMDPSVPTETSSTPPPASSAPTAPPPGGPVVPGPEPGPAPGPVPAAGVGGGSASGDKTDQRGAVRVYNNSTVRGLAAQAAEDMRAAGWTVVEVGNYSGGTIPTTTVYWQTEEQRSAAEAIGENFGMRVEPRFDGIRDASPGLIVIVTNDYSS